MLVSHQTMPASNIKNRNQLWTTKPYFNMVHRIKKSYVISFSLSIHKYHTVCVMVKFNKDSEPFPALTIVLRSGNFYSSFFFNLDKLPWVLKSMMLMPVMMKQCTSMVTKILLWWKSLNNQFSPCPSCHVGSWEGLLWPPCFYRHIPPPCSPNPQPPPRSSVLITPRSNPEAY